MIRIPTTGLLLAMAAGSVVAQAQATTPLLPAPITGQSTTVPSATAPSPTARTRPPRGRADPARLIPGSTYDYSDETSEPDHVVEREATRFIHETVITEQPACGVAHDHIAGWPGLREPIIPERKMRPDHRRARAGDGEAFFGDLPSGAVVQDQRRHGTRVPWG